MAKGELQGKGAVGGDGRASPESGVVYAGRYVLGQHLGDGGMADVTQALDRVTQQQVALKRLRVSEQDKNTQFGIRLFEREYQVLSELAHPRVVEAYDYGVVDGLPYYSMELLDGGDLHGLSPMGVDQVCQVFRDIASVLALLHSRRLVYRDLNPRNIRCTSDGAAKLIDFGAMTVMGASRKIIGTPGFVAPEVVHQQSLDGRTDLYVLGCALYFALTRRAPYMVRDFAQLKLAWTADLIPPSRFAPEVPKALDELIRDLLQLEPAFRPASAAEVMDRLSAIGSLREDEVLQVSGAYLAAPPLIDSQKIIKRVRGHLISAQEGKGRSIILEAPSGTGRTRMLEAVVLEAKLAGTLVLSADGGDAQKGDYGVAESLAGQLLDFAPGALALAEADAPLLGHVLDQIRSAFPETPLQAFADPRDKRPAVQVALREWFVAVGATSAFVVAVDDVERIDEPSLALLALLAAAIRNQRICLVLTQVEYVERGASPALAVLRDHARILPLTVLTREDTQKLLSATFGDSAQLPLVTDRLYEVSRGNARDLMQLAQYLVDTKIVRYEGGRWTLPQQMGDCDLPRTAEEALSRVLDGLDEPSCEVALLFAVSTQSGLSFEECSLLNPEGEQRELLRAFAVLTAADVLQTSGEVYRLSRPVWRRLLRERASTAAISRLHGSIAAVLEQQTGTELLRAHHLRHAGQSARALDQMVAFCSTSVVQTATDAAAFHHLIETLPDNWYELFDWAVREAERTGRPRRDAHMVRFRMSGFIGMIPDSNVAHQEALLIQLRHDVGLDIYDALQDEIQNPEERLKKTFELAQTRYDAANEHERVFSPFEALRPLAQALITAATLFVARLDFHLLKSLPSLKPVESLSPALAVVQLLMEGIAHRMTGRSESSEAAYSEVVKLLDQPDHAGLQTTHAKYTRTGVVKGLGMLDVVVGRERALERVDELQGGPLMLHGGGLIRMLHHYYHSEPKRADSLRRELALLRVESSSMQMLEGTHLVPEVIAQAAARDLPRLKEVLQELESYAEDYSGWKPIIHYGRGEYSRLRGDFAGAEVQLTEGLALCVAGEHQIWPNLAGAHIATLTALDRATEAAVLADAYRSAAEAAEQDRNVLFIRTPQVSALAVSGRLEEARAEADLLIDAMKTHQVSGLLLGGAYEVSAQVAILEGHREAALADIAECAKHLRAESNRSGHARCARLRRELDHSSDSEMATFEMTALQSEIRSRILEVMGKCVDVEQRQQRALEFVLSQSGAVSGALFMNQASGISLAATVNVASGTDGMAQIARHQLVLVKDSEQLSDDDDDDMCTRTEAGEGEDKAENGQAGPRAVLIGHREHHEYVLTGIAVVVPHATDDFALSHVVPEMLSRFLVESGSSTLSSTTLSATRLCSFC